MKYVNKPVPKTDAMSLVTGKPVYTDDLAPSDCLIVKILRSPHANAWVEEIKTDAAKKIEGIACVLTYEDVSHKRFTLAGQTAPEISPWDRYIIDKHVRFVGDPVAIVAGETEEAVDKALKRIKVKYRVRKQFWISTQPRIIPFWCTRRMTGICRSRPEEIISVISVPPM